MIQLNQGSWDYVIDRIKNGYFSRPTVSKSCYYGVGDYLKHFSIVFRHLKASVVFYKMGSRYYHAAIELPDGQVFECNVPDNFREHGIELAIREVHTIPSILELIAT